MKNMKLSFGLMRAVVPSANCGLGVLILFAFSLAACNKKAEQNAMDPTLAANQNSAKTLAIISPSLANVNETILVANVSGQGSEKTDPVLLNPWGLALGAGNSFMVACNRSGLAEVYGADGHREDNPIDIPLNGAHFGSLPAGVVYNANGGLIIPGTGQSAKYIFATENGTIAAWSGTGATVADTTVTVADRSAAGAVYKGIAIADNGGATYIYAADFNNARIDVFDQSFRYVSGASFNDAGIPKGFAPFNIQNIDGKLYVSYAMQITGAPDVQTGSGNGYINIFNPDGSLVMHFAARGILNAPWGMAQTVSTEGAEHILVANYGDGHILAFDMKGNYLGQLGAGGAALSIPGLRSLAFIAGDEKEFENGGKGVLFFTAGSGGGSQGLFGYLSAGKTKVTATAPVNNPLPVSARTLSQ